jgi:hypothetical protein
MALPTASLLQALVGMMFVVSIANIIIPSRIFLIGQNSAPNMGVGVINQVTPPLAASSLHVNDCLLQVAHVTGIKLFSQNDEDGALLQTLRCMGGHGTKEYFEFGSENGMEINTRVLRDVYKWRGHLLDGGNENPGINLHKEFFTPSNIVSLLQKYEVKKSLDVLSIDCDYDDFYIMREILVAGYAPRILVAEYNSNLGNELAVSVKYEHFKKKEVGPNIGHNWKHDCYMGASAAAIIMLGKVFGYTPVWSNTVNLIFVRLDLAVELGLSIPSVQNFPGPWPQRVHADCQGEIWKLIDHNNTAYATDPSLSNVEWSNKYSDINLRFEHFGEDSNYGSGWRNPFVIDAE